MISGMTDYGGPRWQEQVVLALEGGDRGLAMALEREHILSAELGALEVAGGLVYEKR